MSDKIETAKRDKFAELLQSQANDSWARVELYRWQHGEMPPQDSMTCKELSIPEALRAMSMTFCENDHEKWPIPFNIASVMQFAAKELENAENVQALYNELVMAVATKHRGETRHDSALRYIKEREGLSYGAAASEERR